MATQAGPMQKRLNDRTISSLKPAPGERFTDYYDAAMPGFCVRVFAARAGATTCRKTFMWRQRVNGKQQRTTLEDPQTGAKVYPALSLARARELARATQEAISVGRNPAAERREAGERTFERLSELYLAHI